MRWTRATAVGLGLALMGVAPSACGPPPSSTPASAPSAATESPALADPSAVAVSRTPSPPSAASPSSAAGQLGAPPIDRDALVAGAIADAAARAGVAADTVRVVRVESRDWPNSGLGCPSPGTAYAQIITPGLLIVVEVDGRSLEYHADRVRVALCDR